MRITNGLNDGQVLQRNRKNLSETIIKGIVETAGTLSVKVTKNGKPLKGFDFKKLADFKKGLFILQFAGIPAGGPYRIIFKFTAVDGKISFLKFNNIFVGDVWLLAGQSNMEGCGLIKDAAKPHPFVRAFFMNDRWAIAKDPIHNLYEAIDPVHAIISGGVNPVREKIKGTGPGITFGKEMYRLTNVPQGLICCAHGGTSMSQWNPALKKRKNKSLYGALLRRFEKNGSNVAGLLWHQGCSDTHPSKTVALYTQRMKKLIAAFRKDLGLANLPVVMVQISRTSQCVQDDKNWNNIQNQQRLLPKVIKNLSVVPSIDLSLDDWIHISGKGQQRLGRRLAYTAFVQKIGAKAGKKPVELKTVHRKINRCCNTVDIEVEFSNVAGALQSKDRPWGFALVHRNRTLYDAIYDVELKGSRVLIQTFFPVQDRHEIFLHYGLGTMPYCNITDSADRSLPVFGPVEVK
jgi:sialate O-acetylesterase